MLDDRQLGTVLAALRYWQRYALEESRLDDDIATDCGRFNPLADSEIDDLCELLNFDLLPK